MKNAGISKVVLQRKPGQLQVNIITARPGLVFGKANEGLDALRAELQALINRPDVLLQVNLFEVNKIDIDAQLIAESIAQQLELDSQISERAKLIQERRKSNQEESITNLELQKITLLQRELEMAKQEAQLKTDQEALKEKLS